MLEACVSNNSIETQPSIEDGEELAISTSKSSQYKIAMPVISFKNMTANTKADKN